MAYSRAWVVASVIAIASPLSAHADGSGNPFSWLAGEVRKGVRFYVDSFKDHPAEDKDDAPVATVAQGSGAQAATKKQRRRKATPHVEAPQVAAIPATSGHQIIGADGRPIGNINNDDPNASHIEVDNKGQAHVEKPSVVSMPPSVSVPRLARSYGYDRITGTFPSAFAPRTQEQCTEIVLPHEDWLGEVRNQQDLGICFSHDAARLVGYCLNAELPSRDIFGQDHLVSALDLAFKYLRAEWDHKTLKGLRDIMDRGGGETYKALQLASETGGVCSERLLTSDGPSFRARQAEIEHRTGKPLFPNEDKLYHDLTAKEFVMKLLDFREQYTQSPEHKIRLTKNDFVKVWNADHTDYNYKQQEVTVTENCLEDNDHPCFGHLSIMRPAIFSNQAFKVLLDKTTDITFVDELDKWACSEDIPVEARLAGAVAADLRTPIPDKCNGMADFYTQGNYNRPKEDTRGYTLFSELDRQLGDLKRPVGIGVFSDFIQNDVTLNQSMSAHAMVAIGRRWKDTGNGAGVCQYKIRNSWGVNESRFTTKYSKQLDAPYDDKSDFFWMGEDLLSKNLIDIYYVQGKQ